MSHRRKLIEVALPLDAINKESAREKSIRHGHPSTLHMWWARRPLAACRAVLFAQLVDDPSEYMPDEESANEERDRLFHLIEEFVKWENINNEELLDKARLEIARSVARDLGEPVPIGKAAIREFLATKAPPVLDPFAGGGSIPLEAQRLGLRSYASDLNPVAVLINKALIEIPPKFNGLPPVHPPEDRKDQHSFLKKFWRKAEGLADDVRYYGKWMRTEAEIRIGHLYPKVRIQKNILAERPDLVEAGCKPGDELDVIAWLWARTVICPNPVCQAKMPLLRSLYLSTKSGSKAWLEPIIDRSNNFPAIHFKIRVGKGTAQNSPKVGRGAKFRCLACGEIAPEDQLRAEFLEKRDSVQLLAIAINTPKGRSFVNPIDEHIKLATSQEPSWTPLEEMNTETPNLVSGRGYGIKLWSELFTNRQLILLTTFVDLLKDVKKRILSDASSTLSEKDLLEPYANAIVTYLSEAVSKLSTFHNKLAYWRTKETKTASGFGRQALAMTWDFTEVNPFVGAGGDFFEIASKAAPKVIGRLPAYPQGFVQQQDVLSLKNLSESPLVSTDPPYYDNVGYSDLSDFFYIWLRKALRGIYTDLFLTVATPKSSELVAEAYRFGGNGEAAKHYFEAGLNQAFEKIISISHDSYPTTVYYAFKQSEESGQGRVSTGWETMLSSLIYNGFHIRGTWPVRTENPTRALATSGGGTNALASSIVLVCRRRNNNTPIATRRDFLADLKTTMPMALRILQQGSVAPVDLAQAAIGPGMSVFSKYSNVLEADGSSMSVRTALALINQALDEFFAEQEGELDADTRWALAWYEQYGHSEGPFGVAETLSKAKNTSVGGLEQAGILEARAGKVKLLHRSQLTEDWDPTSDKRLTVWEVTQYLIRALDHGGEAEAAFLLSRIGSLGESARDLAYRLYTICERKGWSQDALGYNMLVVAWPRLKELAHQRLAPTQERLL